MGIKHDEYIIRPAVLPQSILSAEVPVSTLGESPPLYNTVRLIHQRLHQQYLYLLQGSQPSALFLYKNGNEADPLDKVYRNVLCTKSLSLLVYCTRTPKKGQVLRQKCHNFAHLFVKGTKTPPPNLYKSCRLYFTRQQKNRRIFGKMRRLSDAVKISNSWPSAQSSSGDVRRPGT